MDNSINLDGVNLFVIKSDIEIMDGTSEFILTMDDRDTANFYWHGQNVFRSILKENVAAPVELFYWVRTHPKIGRITIGIDSKTDDLKIKKLQLLFIHKE